MLRLRLLPRTMGLLVTVLAMSACGGPSRWHGTDISGSIPDLAFALNRGPDGKAVTAADFRGKVTMLYFGYTYCPDVCPLTLSNAARMLKRMGPAAHDVRVLFVTVDPGRDTQAVVGRYAAAFGPQFVGLRGSSDEVATLAKRYRFAYSVAPNADPDKYQVSHSSAFYVFDREGRARLLETSLSQADPDIAGAAADLGRLAGS